MTKLDLTIDRTSLTIDLSAYSDAALEGVKSLLDSIELNIGEGKNFRAVISSSDSWGKYVPDKECRDEIDEEVKAILHDEIDVTSTGIDWNTDGHLPFDIIGELFLGHQCHCNLAPKNTNIIYNSIGHAIIQFTNEIDPYDIPSAVKEIAR